jgi:hypothetical protein
MEPPLRFGQSSRIREIEKKLADLSASNSVHLSPQSVINRIEQKKQLRYNQALEDLENRYITETANHFDLSNKSNLLVNIALFTVKFVAENVSNITSITGMALIGSYRFDLAVQLLFNLFSDVSEKLLGNVIQHCYNITYKKEEEVHVLTVSEDIEKDIDISNEKKNNLETIEAVEPQKKASTKNSLKCHIM